MALLAQLGLVPTQAMLGRVPKAADAAEKVPAKPGNGKVANGVAKGKVAPTAHQLAERKRLEQGLREAVPQVKELAASQHEDAAEAVKLTKETHGLLSWETLDKAKEKYEALKKLLTGKAGVPEESPRRAEKTNAEVSLEEFKSDLGGAIGNIGKMRKAAKAMGADKLEEHLGKVSEGLGIFSEKADKLVEIVELGRDIEEFQRALKVARSLDLNRDYEASAIAMGDLANVGGKLAKAATGDVPGVDAYLTLVQNAGAVWEMGARLHRKTDDMFVATGQMDGPPAEGNAPAEPQAKPKDSTAAIPLGSVEDFMRENMKKIEDEGKWMGGTLINDIPDWELSTDAFVRAFGEFMEMHDKRKKIALGPLSTEYRQLGKEMQAPYDEAMKFLTHLQNEAGSRKDLSATYEPALKAMKKADPSALF